MKFNQYITETNDKQFIETKIKKFIELYKDKFPNYNVYKGPFIKKVIDWKSQTFLSTNNIKSTMKGNIVNALYGKNTNEFRILVFKRDNTKDIIIRATNSPLPLDNTMIKKIKT